MKTPLGGSPLVFNEFLQEASEVDTGIVARVQWLCRVHLHSSLVSARFRYTLFCTSTCRGPNYPLSCKESMKTPAGWRWCLPPFEEFFKRPLARFSLSDRYMETILARLAYNSSENWLLVQPTNQLTSQPTKQLYNCLLVQLSSCLDSMHSTQFERACENHIVEENQIIENIQNI